MKDYISDLTKFRYGINWKKREDFNNWFLGPVPSLLAGKNNRECWNLSNKHSEIVEKNTLILMLSSGSL
jgi:hypothetical protein